MRPFRSRSDRQDAPESPEALFRDLRPAMRPLGTSTFARGTCFAPIKLSRAAARRRARATDGRRQTLRRPARRRVPPPRLLPSRGVPVPKRRALRQAAAGPKAMHRGDGARAPRSANWDQVDSERFERGLAILI